MKKETRRVPATDKEMVLREGCAPKQLALSPEKVKSMFALLRNRLAKDNRVLAAYVHGSFLTRLPSHDLDIAVLFSDCLSPHEKIEASLSLQEDMSHGAGVPLDVHPIDPENLAFAFDAVSGELLFSRDNEARDRFEERTIALYMDFKPMLRQILEDLTEVTPRP